MRVVLAEKPSVARELASFLGAAARRDGYFEGRGYRVTWALGHLVTLKEPQDYDPALKKWSLATLPIVPERFELKPIEEKGSRAQLAVVRRLFRAADEIICATDAGREGVLKVADLELDENSHEVTRAGVEVHLTATEFELLRYLMRNERVVLSKAQILDHVWNYDFNGEANVVESYISYLRRKIDTTDPRLLHTIRGVGYTLRLPRGS